MKLKQLKQFKVLAEIEHYARASESLGISQSYLSTSIKDLEDEIGFTLFDRNNRNVSLTRKGAIFLEYVTKSMDLLDEGIKYIKETGKKTSAVNVGMLPEVPGLLGPSIFSDMDIYHEDKKIKLNIKKISNNSKDLFNDLKNYKLDVIFATIDNIKFEEKVIDYSKTYSSNPSKTLNSLILVPLLNQKFVLLVNKNHPLAKYESVRMRQVLDYPLIKYSDNTSLNDYMDNLLKFTNNRIYEHSYIVDTYELAAGLAASGFGVAIVPDSQNFDHFDAHKIDISYPVYSRTIYMALLKNKNLTPEVKKVYREILKYSQSKHLISENFKHKVGL